MVAASLFFASSLAVSAAEPEIKLSRIVTAAAKDGQKFEEITGLYAERDGSIRLGDSGAGTLVTIGASAMESAIIASKQGLFGSRRLGGVARINADLLAVVKGGENMIAVVDNKGALRYLIGESGGDQGQLKDPGEIVYSPPTGFMSPIAATIVYRCSAPTACSCLVSAPAPPPRVWTNRLTSRLTRRNRFTYWIPAVRVFRYTPITAGY